MPRQYIVNSWVGAAEYDEGDTYSGEQVGNRNQKSIEVPIRRSGDQWKADIPTFIDGRPNIAAFAEPEQKPKVKKKKSVADSIDLSNRHLERMEKLSEQLDEEFLAGEIDEERYELLRYKMDERLIKAFRRVEKENAPIWEMEDAKFNASKQPVECEWKESNTLAWGSKENDSKGLKSPLKQGIDNGFELDYSLIKKDSFFSSISDDNFFKKLFVMGLTVVKKLSKIGNVTKSIIQDGLI